MSVGTDLPSGPGQTTAAKSMSVVPASDSPAWPVSVSSTAWTRSFTVTALASKLIVKASAGTFRSVAGRLDKSAPTGDYFIRVWDAADVPADTTAASLVNAISGAIKIQHSNGVEDYWEIEYPDPGVAAANGIVVGLSTTEFTQTAGGAYLSVTGAAYR